MSGPPLFSPFFPRQPRACSFLFHRDVPRRGKSPYLYFHLLCIPWGITRTGVARFSLGSFFAESTVVPALSLGLSTAFPSRGWRGAGLANSFKSRCGPGNSTNPLRIHRAPLANSSPLLTSSFPRSLLPLPSRCGFSRVLPSPPLSHRPFLPLPPADPVQVSPTGALRQLLGPLSASPPRFHAVSETGVVGPFRKWLVFGELKFRVVRWTLRLLGTRR